MAEHLSDTSRHRVQLAIDAEYVRVNGQVVKASYKVRPLDVITLVMPYQRRGVEIKPEPIPLDIVYEDDDLLVVNKPAGLVVHPGHGNYSGTLVNALAYYLGRESVPGETDERLGLLVHRIDKDTSGLLVVAKTDVAQIDLARQFFHHTIERRYWALVWGNIAEDSGTIDANIGRDPNDRLRFKVCSDPSQGKTAVTHFRVLERLGYVTLVECVLETGRTHQIRVHLSHLGHPIVGDFLYGTEDARLPGRFALHSTYIRLVHPVTGQVVEGQSPLPEGLMADADILGATVTVTMDRPLGSRHPSHPDMIYPVNYGFIRGLPAADGEDQDAYVLGPEAPLEALTGRVAAIVRRRDDAEDKWVVCPAGCSPDAASIMEQIRFQEQYFDSTVIMPNR